MSSLGYFRLFLARAHNARYTFRSRPSVAKASFRTVFVGCTFTSGLDSGRPRWAGVEHPAGILKSEFQKMLSGFEPVRTLFSEHLEDDTAEMSAEGTDGLIMFLAL